MNPLQKLFRLRGETVAKLAKRIGFNYHSVQKVVKGTLPGPQIRPAIVGYLNRQYRTGLTEEQVFGPEAGKFLRRLYDTEISKKKSALEESLKSKLRLGSHSKNQVGKSS